MSENNIFRGNIALDHAGRVVLSDEMLARFDNAPLALSAGGSNTAGCSNTGCSNLGCADTTNMACSNVGCGGNMNKAYCVDEPI